MSVSCLLLTFNCAKRAQSSAEVQALLESILENVASRPHFLVLALQESASFLDAAFNHLDEWLSPFTAAATSIANGAYEYVAQKHVGAVALLVFSTGEKQVRRIVKGNVQFGKFWSNLKGAASISLVLDSNDDRLTFVSAHLAANEGHLADRNRDFALLENALSLSKMAGQVFVFGDLNYRASDSTFESDELVSQMRQGHTAWGFTEAPVKFQPSFKYHVGTSDLNTKRHPSWCDRVLYRASSDIRIQTYDSIMSFTSSDHKPVVLVLETPTALPAPVNALSVPTVKLPPSWLPLTVDRTIGSALFLGTTRTGWLIIGLSVIAFFFINSF